MILEEGEEVPEWVIGTWHFGYGLELFAVGQFDGKPRPDLGARAPMNQWYTWLSYHAARKFQRSHPELEGYIIFNLGAARQQYMRRVKLREERLAKDTADLLKEQPPPLR